MSIEKIRSVIRMIEENNFNIKERLGDLNFKDKEEFDIFMKSDNAPNMLKNMGIGLDAANAADDIASRTLGGGNTNIGGDQDEPKQINYKIRTKLKKTYSALLTYNLIPDGVINPNTFEDINGYTTTMSSSGRKNGSILNGTDNVRLFHDDKNNLVRLVYGPYDSYDVDKVNNFINTIDVNKDKFGVLSIKSESNKVIINYKD